MSAAEARSELVMDIIKDKVSKNDLIIRLNDLEEIYGEEAFTSYSFKKQTGPWTEEYYRKLEDQAIAGAGSKEFIMHLYDVKASVNTGKKIERRGILNSITEITKAHLLVAIIIVAAVIIIAVFI